MPDHDYAPNVVKNSLELLLYVIPITLFIIFVRVTLQTFLIRPFGIYGGLKPGTLRKAQPHPLLEKAYEQSKKWSRYKVLSLSKEANLTQREVDIWFSRRKGSTGPTTLDKFCDEFCKFLYYTVSFISGTILICIHPGSITDLWVDYDKSLTGIWWHNRFTMALYVSLCVGQLTHEKRKDFWEMFIHHMLVLNVGICIMIFELERIGVICVTIHDFSDIFVELSKCMKYLKYPRAPNILFSLFVASWLITRTGIFPFWFIKQSLDDSQEILKKLRIYYVWNALYCVMFSLHCYWTYQIIKFTINNIRLGYIQDDIRSDSDQSEDESKVV